MDSTSGSNGFDGRIKEWLDSKEPESVLYVAFGSECCFGPEQLREIALGLAGCRHPFLWVVRGGGGGADTMHQWLPQGFHDTVGDRGLIVTEWVPQAAILNHPSVGGSLTHCGWNSILEAVCAGLPVIAWPLLYEQFVNERHVVEILKIGVRIKEGEKMRTLDLQKRDIVRAGLLQAAVDRLMGGSSGGDEEVRAMRNNAKRYGELARSAMLQEGGSSYVNLASAIEEIKMHVKIRKEEQCRLLATAAACPT